MAGRQDVSVAPWVAADDPCKHIFSTHRRRLLSGMIVFSSNRWKFEIIFKLAIQLVLVHRFFGQQEFHFQFRIVTVLGVDKNSNPSGCT